MEINLKTLFNEFMQQQECVKLLRPETLRGYRQVFTTFTKLMPNVTNAEMITYANMLEFFNILHLRERLVGKRMVKTGVKKSTILTYRRKLSLFFEWLRIKEYIPKNPFSNLPFPKVVYEDCRFLKKEDVNKILTAIISHPSKNPLVQKRDLLMFYILLLCGLRKQELISLEIRDIDVNRKEITIRGETSKSGKTRRIPLHSNIIACYKDYLKERNDQKYKTPFLFVSSDNDRGLSVHGLKHWVERLKKLSGVRFHLHQFRHTFATNFLNSTHTSNNIIKLKELMGHKDIVMTQVYLRGLPIDEMRADIEGMNIDNLI